MARNTTHDVSGKSKICGHRVSYWFASDVELSDNVCEILAEEAECHMCDSIIEGYTEGELVSELNDMSFRGWWNVVEGIH